MITKYFCLKDTLTAMTSSMTAGKRPITFLVPIFLTFLASQVHAETKKEWIEDSLNYGDRRLNYSEFECRLICSKMGYATNYWRYSHREIENCHKGSEEARRGREETNREAEEDVADYIAIFQAFCMKYLPKKSVLQSASISDCLGEYD